MSNKLVQLNEAGVSPWLDNLKREMFGGELLGLIKDQGVRGQTSNPSIFQSAISKSDIYDTEILELAKKGMTAEDIVWELMSADVRSACGIFSDLFEKSQGKDGYVSLELNPTMAHETEKSLKQAYQLVEKVNSPNLMIKVPATKEGLPVVTALIAEGINVNVTLLFSVERYEEVIDAWMEGLEKRAKAGKSIKNVNSVASFFISRLDTEADKRMDKQTGDFAEFRGKVAVANARLAYQLFLKKMASNRWKELEKLGAPVQRPLWASTSTKNPNYKDTLYVDELIGENCVNTMPDETVKAFSDHGVITNTLNEKTLADAEKVMADFAKAGFDVKDITDVLMTEGVDKFAVAYQKLLEAVEAKRAKLLA